MGWLNIAVQSKIYVVLILCMYIINGSKKGERNVNTIKTSHRYSA